MKRTGSRTHGALYVKDIHRCIVSLAGAALLMTATALPAAGQDTLRRVTLDEALELFARNNGDLRVARAEAAESAALARQAAAYPNPEASATHEPLSGGGRSYSESYFNLSQRLQWPGTRSARQAAADRIAAAAAARLSADSIRLAFQVKEAWIDAALAERSVALMERVTTVFRTAERSAEERLREGDVSAYDRRRITIERLRYENALADVRLFASTARRTLAMLVLPESDDLEVGPADTLGAPPGQPDLKHLMRDAVGRRSEIAAAAAALEAARADARATRSGRVPDVTATGGYKRQSDGMAGAFLGLSIPLPLWNRSSGAVEAADARVAAADARLAQAERQVRNDVARALLAYQAAVARIAMLADPQADAADLLTIAQIAYDAGEMELVQLLDAANALREAMTLEARLRAALWTSWFDLERAVGGFDARMNNEEDA
jgi:outer membrane protein, heavy metal efflux system